jgi:hypothetical protein
MKFLLAAENFKKAISLSEVCLKIIEPEEFYKQ